MGYRIHPFWWPTLGLLSPALGVYLSRKSRAYRVGVKQAEKENTAKIEQAEQLELTEIESLELTVIVEAKAAEGFCSDAAVSYLMNNKGHKVLFDVGYGPENAVFANNWRKLGLSMNDLDAVVLSHQHLDHMGGILAQMQKKLLIPKELAPTHKIPCFLQVSCASPFFDVDNIIQPCLLPSGFATTGSLARMLFYLGCTYEQSLIADLRGKGLIVVIGCGHPTLEVILSMVRKLSDSPIYAVVGGLHFPIRSSRAPKVGIQVERIFGTGKSWNDPINDEDLNNTIQSATQSQTPTLTDLSPRLL